MLAILLPIFSFLFLLGLCFCWVFRIEFHDFIFWFGMFCCLAAYVLMMVVIYAVAQVLLPSPHGTLPGTLNNTGALMFPIGFTALVALCCWIRYR